MQINYNKDKSGEVEAAIAGEMTIYSAAELKTSLVNNMKDCSGVKLDLSSITKIDTAGYQLLLAAKLEAAKKNIPFKITNPSQEVLDIFELFGESC